MIKTINLGDKNESIKALKNLRERKGVSRYIRIINSNIKELNKIIGKNIFKKDAVFIRSTTLWEIMQPIGGKGEHHYHGLSPEDIYNALSRIQYSKQVTVSSDARYIAITDIEVSQKAFLVVVIKANSYLFKLDMKKVVVIITIYPKDK